MFLLNIFLYIWIFGTLFFPYIMSGILSVIIILLIRKKLTEKDKSHKTLIYTIIIIVCTLVCVILGYSVMSYLSAKPDKVYVEMNKINDSKKLIGMSKDEVTTLLGEPLYSFTDNTYVYDAGKITNYLFLGEREFYKLYVYFDENNNVKATSIDFPRGG